VQSYAVKTKKPAWPALARGLRNFFVTVRLKSGNSWSQRCTFCDTQLYKRMGNTSSGKWRSLGSLKVQRKEYVYLPGLVNSDDQ
jgi:hypothetical protein